ncbi:hypothetical protein [Rariglobus hedericola]|uniref:Verru_Chthon cassette protein A n=1 Tax=Rariglobus hedericola TaxID=2597822 RepID=A0A556QSE0_9BACT|nr:hypothetical protein [Rariglobus hedericola]TSJ79558.1 hypothetical protein FPL22_09810 [Rariglobus hedericola]
MKRTAAVLPVTSRPQARRGFALLITITLLAFLVLLLVSLASLTRVETQVAANSQHIAQARQNALLALNIAMGQLQKYTGPDQRVTAPADLKLPASVTITPPTYDFGTSSTGGSFTASGTTGAQAIAAVDAYWKTAASPRNRHWVGAWKNARSDPATYNKENPSAFNPLPANPADDSVLTPAWLVSGNELSSTGDTFKPADVVTGLTAASTPLDEIKDASNRVHRLLLKTSAGVTGPASLDRAITAPQITISATNVPGTSGAATPVGNYAWWVGDEGVKARANLVDSYAAARSGESASEATARTLTRLQSAQRPAIEAMTTTGSDGLAATFPVNTAELLKVFSPTQLTYLNPAATFPDELKSRYHDLSVSSRGVLADVRQGGLKRDFTYLFARPSLADFRTALNTTDFNVAPLATGNFVLSPAATPYANRPAILTANVFDCSSTWEQLWSHANSGNAVAGDLAPSRTATATQQGLFPVFVQAKLFYSLRVEADRTVTLRIYPVVVLANPYNVALSGDFLLSYFSPNPSVVSGRLSDPAPAPASLVNDGTTRTNLPNHFVRVGNALANGGLEKIQLVIKATRIPPGVAQIFTLDPAANLTIAGSNDTHTVAMINTFDPSVFLTYPTGRAIATAQGDTHAALISSGMSARLYMGNTTNPSNLIVSVGTKSPQTSTGAPVDFGFVVYPVADGYRRGGGVFFTLQDAQSTPQQATFYQLNYRALLVDYIGFSSYSDHPLQWGTSFGVIGLDGDSDPSGHPMLAANHLPPLDETIPSTTRWGLINSGAYPSLTSPPADISDPNTSFNTRLYDIPTPGHALTSLGQLQHFNLAGFFLSGGNSISNSFQVNYPIANSYPQPRVRRDRVFHYSPPFGNHFDGSYLWNDLLWDRFYFSSFPQTGPFDFAQTNTDTLANARYTPFRSPALVPYNDPSRFRGLYAAAENLLADGAFNINSTSVEAWKALFSSLKNIPAGTDTAPSAPFLRTLTPSGGSANSANGISANAWSGLRDLTQSEINRLAEEMVLQVRLRGPFLSLSQFVNRLLIAGPTTNSNSGLADPYRLGLSGALQSALDKVVNQRAHVPSPYNTTSEKAASTGTRDGTGVFRGLIFADLEYRMQTRIAGYPGYLLQGDLLSALAPTLTARSDTFTIRTYGDTLNPATGDVMGRAWCEAVVQRTPDYVDATPASSTPASGSAAATFGRRYQIVSFRWLSPNDI